MLAVERSYSQVQMTLKETKYEDGIVYSISDQTLYRNNNNVKQVTRYVEALDPNIAKGTVFVHGWANQYSYDLRRVSGADEFEILSYNPSNGFSPAVHSQCPPLFAAFCLYEHALSEYLTLPNTTILSVDSDVLDGRDVFSIYTEYFTPESPDETTRYRLYFDRNNFLFLGLTGYWRPKSPDAVYFERRIVYQDIANSSKLKSVVQWSVSPKDPSVRNIQFEDDVQSIDFGPVPTAEFALASSGVEEPSSDTARESNAPSAPPSQLVADESSTSSSTWFLILLVAVAFGVFGIVFAVMASRKRKATE